jgi:cytochrome c oxidase cbb3-type subunit 2
MRGDLLITAALAAMLALPTPGEHGVPAQESDLRQELDALKKEFAEVKGTARKEAGQRIYESACLVCHGRNGDGRGPKARALRVPPRDFRQGMYKWRSTVAGALPTDEDLDRTIRRGISGTEMVPFGKIMSRQNRARVIEYIKSFSSRFSDPAQAPKAETIVAMPAQRPFPRSEASIAAGKALYQAKGCLLCHGENGDGRGPAAASLMDAWGNAIRPWDFTLGYYKSGRTELDLYRTVTTGLNGTPMPAFAALTTEEERWQLIDFIVSLGKPRKGFWFALFSEEPTGLIYDEEP